MILLEHWYPNILLLLKLKHQQTILGFQDVCVFPSHTHLQTRRLLWPGSLTNLSLVKSSGDFGPERKSSPPSARCDLQLQDRLPPSGTSSQRKLSSKEKQLFECSAPTDRVLWIMMRNILQGLNEFALYIIWMLCKWFSLVFHRSLLISQTKENQPTGYVSKVERHLKNDATSHSFTIKELGM